MKTIKVILRTSLVILVIIVAGFIAVYLITPYPLEWHMKYSTDRLVFQLYPVFIFGLMLFTRDVSSIKKLFFSPSIGIMKS